MDKLGKLTPEDIQRIENDFNAWLDEQNRIKKEKENIKQYKNEFEEIVNGKEKV